MNGIHPNTNIEIARADHRDRRGMMRDSETKKQMRLKHKRRVEHGAKMLVDRAKEVIPADRYPLAIKKLNAALDLRGLNDMTDRAKIAEAIDCLKAKRGPRAIELLNEISGAEIEEGKC